MKAITREEKIMSGENLTPITRKEMFLAKASGQNIQTPTPITREEYFLSKITSSGGGTGGSDSVEGTAIPVGVPVDKIYFNTNLSVEETNAYLSQLSYVQTELMEYPICGIWGYMTSQNTTIIYAMAEPLSSNLKRCYVGGIIINNDTGTIRDIFEIFNPAKDSNVQKNKGFATMDYDSCVQLVYGTAFYWETISATPTSEFMGLPLGLENEKIKNVLSITPFGASGGTSNKPTAYTVSSVDELPSDAVDGSTAIVPSDSLIGEWEWKDNQSPLNLSMFNFPNDLTYDERVAINGYDSFLGVFNDISFSKVDSFIIKFGNTNLYVDDAFDDSYTTFSLYTDILYIIGDDITEENFKEFIKTNCNRLSGGYSLYTRENGEWVYKCEVA